MFSGLSANEAQRLAALELLKREDKERDSVLGELAEFARHLMGVSGCFVTIIDDAFQYIKYVNNVPLFTGCVPLEETMCRHSLPLDEPVICPDARQDARFSEHPIVQNGAVIFYAVAPIKTRDGHTFAYRNHRRRRSPFTLGASGVREYSSRNAYCPGRTHQPDGRADAVGGRQSH